jgi:hypothetical protein
MAEPGETWKTLARWTTIAVIAGIAVYPGTPDGVRVVLAVLAFVAPFAPVLALVPWYFHAVHRGLVARSKVRCAVTISGATLHVDRGERRTSHALDAVAAARLAWNDNWTESNLLEDALTLFSARGRVIERIARSSTGCDALLDELRRRGASIEQVDVSAPVYLD